MFKKQAVARQGPTWWFQTEIHILLEKRIEYAKQVQGSGMEIHDPIEDDPLYQGFLQAAEKEVEEELRNEIRDIGFCHRFWYFKQKILVQKYGVIWFSPEDMNPHMLYD